MRRLIWGPHALFQRPLGFYVAAFESVGYPHRDERVYVSYARPGRSISRYSMRDDRTVFLFVVDAEHMTSLEPTDDAERKAALHAVFADMGWEAREVLAALDGDCELYFDRVAQSEVESWSKDRAVLIGDAAACPSLLAGEGTGLAITEAYVLAGELQRAGGDVASALSAYEARLRPFLTAKQKSARKFASSFAPKTEFGLQMRNLATKLMTIPPLADLFVGASVRDDFNLPDYGL